MLYTVALCFRSEASGRNDSTNTGNNSFFFGQLESIDVTGLGRNPETRHLAKKKQVYVL
jgi:hypothetical protein